jgi:hypothetical protein
MPFIRLSDSHRLHFILFSPEVYLKKKNRIGLHIDPADYALYMHIILLSIDVE